MEAVANASALLTKSNRSIKATRSLNREETQNLKDETKAWQGQSALRKVVQPPHNGKEGMQAGIG